MREVNLTPLSQHFKNEVKDVSDRTMRNYLYYINRLPIQTPKDFVSTDDNKLIQILIKSINGTPERGRLMARASMIKLLTLFNKESLSIKLPKYKLPVRRIGKKWLSFGEIKKIVDSTNDDLLKLTIMLQYDCCSRISSILNLKVEDIIDTSKQIIIVEEKTNERRTATLSNKTFELLKAYVVEHKPEIDGRDGVICPFCYQTIYKKQKKLFNKVLDSKISSHWFRASRAVHLASKGHSMDTIKQQGGWRSADSVLTYIKESGIDSKKLMEREEPEW
jgi:integrase